MATPTSGRSRVTTFYRPREGAPLPHTVAYIHDNRWRLVEEAELAVHVPVRYVAFDTDHPRGQGKAEDFDPDEIMDRATRPTNPFGVTEAFQITYSFSRRIRQNEFPFLGTAFKEVTGEYGAPNLSFRQLYDFLSATYNGGEPFIDTYFKTAFPYRAVGRQMKAFEDAVRTKLFEEYYRRAMAAYDRKTTKSGRADMRTREGRYLNQFSAWKEEKITRYLRAYQKDIAQDIEACLRTGQIRFTRPLGKMAERVRSKFGFTSGHLFYASGQLAKDIQIDIRMKEDAFGNLGKAA